MTELLALEGGQVVHCPMCRRDIKVWWFANENGLITFDVSLAVDEELQYRQWLEQNLPIEAAHERTIGPS